jgi:hypothetical protein
MPILEPAQPNQMPKTESISITRRKITGARARLPSRSVTGQVSGKQDSGRNPGTDRKFTSHSAVATKRLALGFRHRPKSRSDCLASGRGFSRRSRPTPIRFPLPQDTPANERRSNDSAIASCSRMYLPWILYAIVFRSKERSNGIRPETPS